MNCQLCNGEHTAANHRIRLFDLCQHLKIHVSVESTGVPFSTEKRIEVSLTFGDVEISKDSTLIS